MLNPDLRDILVCPIDHAALDEADDALVCTACGRCYPIIDGIPNMLPDEAAPTDEA